MTHCTYRSRVRVGHQTATGPVTPTCSWDRWGRAETERTALGEALVMRRRTRVRFPPPPPRGLGEMPGSSWRKAGATANSGGPGFVLSGWSSHAQAALPGPQSSTSPSQVGLRRLVEGDAGLAGRRATRRCGGAANGGGAFAVSDASGLVGPHGEFDAVSGAELAHEAGQVGFDGARGDVELAGDLIVGAALGYRHEDFLLAGGERFYRLPR